jgi:hypothetical protein
MTTVMAHSYARKVPKHNNVLAAEPIQIGKYFNKLLVLLENIRRLNILLQMVMPTL